MTNQRGVDYAQVHWSEPVLQGGVDLIRTNATHLPGERFELGRTNVSYVVYSSNDDEALIRCSFAVEVTGRIFLVRRRGLVCP